MAEQYFCLLRSTAKLFIFIAKEGCRRRKSLQWRTQGPDGSREKSGTKGIAQTHITEFFDARANWDNRKQGQYQ